MTIIQRRVFVGCLILLSLYVFLFPTWKGFRVSQVVGLERNRAPIWNPPSYGTSSPESGFWNWTRNPVRWPFFQPPKNQLGYVEIAVGRTLARWTFGMMIFGLIFRVTSKVYRSNPPDRIISIGWSVTIGLGVAWLGLLVIPLLLTVLSAETETFATGIFTVGALGGLAFGIWRNFTYRNGKSNGQESAGKAGESSPVGTTVGTRVGTRVALKARSKIILVSRVASLMALLAACISAALSGLGLNLEIAGILLLVSFAVFSCVELDRWRLGWGGVVLCGLTLLWVFMACYVAIQGTARFDVFGASVFSICIGAPMFATGTLLFFSAERRVSVLDYAWWIEFVLAVSVAVFFLFYTGHSVERIMHEWLEWIGLDF